MKHLIQRWLGIEQLARDNMELISQLVELKHKLTTLQGQIVASNMGMGRILAKLDPMYSVAYDDPERKAASDKLSKEIIQKLFVEQVISNRMQTGDPE